MNPGSSSAKELAQSTALGSRTRFEQCDVSKSLPFDDETFDAVFSNDVLCHFPGSLDLLAEMFRVLKPWGDFVQRRSRDRRNDLRQRNRNTSLDRLLLLQSSWGESKAIRTSGFSDTGWPRRRTENAARI